MERSVNTSGLSLLMLASGAVVTGLAAGTAGNAQGAVVSLGGLSFLVLAFLRVSRLPRASQLPWLILTSAGTLLILGAIARAVYGQFVGVEDPLPSPADLVSVAGYSAAVLGQVVLIRRRSPIADLDSWIDALIVTAAIGLGIWTVLLSDYFTDTAIPSGQRSLNALYFTLTLALLTTTIRLAIGTGDRARSYYLFATSACVFFLEDLLGTVAYSQHRGISTALLLSPSVYAFFCAALYHPTVVRLTDAPLESEPRLGARRLVMLAGALLVPPLVMTFESSRPETVDQALLISSALSMSTLVLVRMTRLVRARERLAAQEQALRVAAENFVTATSQEQVNIQAEAACSQLLQDEELLLAKVLSHEQSVSVREAASQDASMHLATFARGSASTGGLVVRTSKPLPKAARTALDSLAREIALAQRSVADAEQENRLRNERKFRALLTNSSDIVSVLDADKHVAFCSPASDRILGRPADSLEGRPPFEYVHPSDRERADAVLTSLSSPARRSAPLELRMRHADGTYRWFEMAVRDLRSNPDVNAIVVNAHDTTDRRSAETRLVRSEARFRALVQNSSDVVAVMDERGVFTYVSPAVTPMLGYVPEQLVGTDVLALLSRDDEPRARAFGLLLTSKQSFEQSLIEVRVDDAEALPHSLDITLTDLRRDPAVRGVVLNARDVTIRRSLERSLEHQASHDSLTGLGNRSLFTARLAEALNRHNDRLGTVGVLYVDLDDFKAVNDGLGMAVGDEVLALVAERIHGCLRISDVAARFGGDAFAVLLVRADGSRPIETVAGRILMAMKEPIRVRGAEVEISASIGGALNSESDCTSADLLRNADTSLHHAKDLGKDRYEMLKPEPHSEVFERLEMKSSLRKGIEAGELVIYYQPILAIVSGVVTGVEALVRWRHPEKGLLGPGAFVPLAEESGLIVQLGSWVLRESVRQLAAWRARGLVGEDFTMSVNLSVRQLEEERVISEFEAVLSEHAVPARNVVVEITESLLVDEGSGCQRRLQELRSLGFLLAIDDFGTGYSGLGYLQRFPIDVVKIDKSFVDGLDGSDSSSTLVRAIIDFASQLGARTVAEGIEHAEQLAALRGLGCQSVQGFLFSRPVPAAEFASLVTAQGHRAPVLSIDRVEGSLTGR